MQLGSLCSQAVGAVLRRSTKFLPAAARSINDIRRGVSSAQLSITISSAPSTDAHDLEIGAGLARVNAMPTPPTQRRLGEPWCGYRPHAQRRLDVCDVVMDSNYR